MKLKKKKLKKIKNIDLPKFKNKIIKDLAKALTKNNLI